MSAAMLIELQELASCWRSNLTKNILTSGLLFTDGCRMRFWRVAIKKQLMLKLKKCWYEMNNDWHLIIKYTIINAFFLFADTIGMIC